MDALLRRTFDASGPLLRCWIGPCMLAVSLAGCGSDRDDPELAAANAWLQQVKAERREDAAWLSNACVEENGFPLTRDGMLAHVECMKRKDERHGRSAERIRSGAVDV